MKPLSISIRLQLLFGFTILLLLVALLGSIAFIQSKRIHQQTKTLYEHPLQVRRALGRLNVDIVTLQRDVRNLILYTNHGIISENLIQILDGKEDADEQASIISDLYLGPRSDVDSLKYSLMQWNILRDETIRFIANRAPGDLEKPLAALEVSNRQANILLSWLEKIDAFSKNKTEELYTKSEELVTVLNRRLVIFAIVSLLISAIIFNILIQSIRKPMEELYRATQAFHAGDLSARSRYVSKNEIGVFSQSFNNMAEGQQAIIGLGNKRMDFSRMLLKEDDKEKFFRGMLTKLCEVTGAQMAAAYMLSEDKKEYVHYSSIGLDDHAKRSFSAIHPEGEFGLAVSSGKIRHIKNISDDSRFIFNTPGGGFTPAEIITLPISEGESVSVIISIATTGKFEKTDLDFIEFIQQDLVTRIEAIIAIGKIIEISAKLEAQNQELEMQSRELITQSSILKEQNTELEVQKKQLAEVSQLKTVFLSNMSHELRTPLNSVIALAGVLNRRLAGKIPEEEFSYLDVIGRNGKHLLALINDILDISRIESGKEEVEVSKFNINELVTNIMSIILPQAREKNIDLVFKPGADGLVIASDSGKMGHILQNLIGNAIKFTEKGTVTVKTTQAGDNINIIVADTGIGIAEEHIGIIFDEFRQADSSTSRRFGGTGLGLALARNYARLLGGDIAVKSIHNEGSEFTLTLPLKYNADLAEDMPESIVTALFSKHYVLQDPAPGNPGKTILLVEDSEPAIIQVQDLLEEHGLQVLVARDGKEALALLSHTIPDAMILDLMMPGIDGFQVLKSVREQKLTLTLPVLILTSKIITKEELSFLKSNNIHQVIRKGDINLDELISSISSMLKGNNAEEQAPATRKRAIEGKPVVLIVEDNPDNMLAVKAILGESYKVIEARDGHEGIEAATKHLPDLILMDIGLPGMNGIEAFKEIRKNNALSFIPIIALTASAMAQDQESILAYGFDAYLAKPINEKEFFKTINETLYGA
jgi:signal transduction histidine kinase/DNA-binding response OmpR family regulator